MTEESGDSWLRQASKNKVRTRSPKMENVAGDFDKRVSVTNAIREDESERKKSSTSMYLRPTTMRGIPLASLTPSPVTRGFYVTRSENDLVSPTSAHHNFTSSYTTENLIEQQTETTLTLDFSTIDETFTVARNDRNETKSKISNNDVNDSVTDETVTIVHNDQNKLQSNNPDDNVNGVINNKGVDIREEKFPTFSSSVISSEDSGSTENLSDYEEEVDVITIPVSRSAFKRGKSLRNFRYDTTPLPNAHVVSSTTPTRRKIAVAVSKYNEATTPLWTGRRVVARKRNRTTVSPIKDAIKRAESNSIRATASTFESASATSTISSVLASRRKRPVTSTIPTIPLIMSESITSSKISNIRNDLANSKTEDPNSRVTAETAITVTDSLNATPSISKITSTTDNPTTIVASTTLDDSATVMIRTIANAPIITTTPASVAVTKAPTDATDVIITTTSATISAETEITSVITNHSVVAIPTTASMHVIPNNFVTTFASANTEIETTSIITNYSTDFVDTTPVTISTEVETTPAITSDSTATIPEIANTNAIVTDSAVTSPSAATVTEIEITSTIANSVVTVPATVNTQAITTDPAITTTPATTHTGVEIISTMTDHPAVTVPAAADTHESATDFENTTAEQVASIGVDTISTTADYPVVAIPATVSTRDVATNSAITTTPAATSTEIETTSTITTTIPETTNTRATTPISVTTISPLTTVISSTTDTHVHATPPMTTSNLADADTIAADTITMTTSANIIIPTITDSDVITTSSNANIPHSNSTSIIDALTTTTQSRTDFVTSSEASITSMDATPTSSATSATLTTESSTIHFVNPSITDVSDNPEVLAVTATAESTQTVEIPTTFETSPIFTPTTIAISESLPSTNSETSSASTTVFSIETNENSVTPMITQTSSTLLSILTPITNTETVASERSTVSSTLPATLDESIATNFVIQTATNTYEPDSMQTINEESTTPELKIDLQKATSRATQNRTESRTTTSIYEPSTVRTTSEESTTLEEKVNSTENTLKVVRIRKQNQTTTESDTINYQFGEKSSRRRVINRTNNWIGRPVTQQTINQYPRRRITVYRGRPRRPPNTSSSRIVEENRRRRIMQKRVRVKAIDSTVRPESIVQNTTEDHVGRIENTRRRMKVVLKRVKEKVEEETTLLPIKETTAFLPSSTTTENETLQTYHKTGNLDRKRKVVLKRIKPQSRENFVTEETSVNFDPTSESLPDNSQDNLRAHEDLPEQEKTRKRMRVVLKSVRPKSDEKNSIKEANVNSDTIDDNLQNNFSRNPHADENLFDEGKRGRRMRVVLKSVKPKSNEKNSTIEETNADSHPSDENVQDTPLNNLSTSKNLPDEERTRGKKRVVLKRIRPKSEEGQTTTEKASADFDSADEILQGTFSNNFRSSENLPVEYKTKRRMRVVLKSVKPKSEEKDSTSEDTSADSDSTNKDLQGSFSSNFHANENLSDEEARRRTEVTLKNIERTSKERDSIAEETNADSDFIEKDPRVLYTFNFSSDFQVGNNPLDKKKTAHANSEEEEATTGQPKDTGLQTTGTSVLVDEDTDRPSPEATSSQNSGPVRRKPGSGNSNRHRKPTQSTTVAPVTNTLSSTLTTHRRGRPVESTLSSRIDHLVDTFEGPDSYIKLAATENDQKADVSDQSIHAQEFAVTLAEPPSSSSGTGRTPLRDAVGRKISTTVAPRTDPTTTTTVSRYGADFRSRQRPKMKNRPTVNVTTRPRKPPVIDYDYYEDDVPIVIGKSVLNSKLFLTSKGTIRCLDQGNFPHPYSCKKFITCARMVNGQVIGTEYTCPAKLSFDPVGGICNWSAGLGCKD